LRERERERERDRELGREREGDRQGERERERKRGSCAHTQELKNALHQRIGPNPL